MTQINMGINVGTNTYYQNSYRYRNLAKTAAPYEVVDNKKILINLEPLPAGKYFLDYEGDYDINAGKGYSLSGNELISEGTHSLRIKLGEGTEFSNLEIYRDSDIDKNTITTDLYRDAFSGVSTLRFMSAQNTNKFSSDISETTKGFQIPLESDNTWGTKKGTPLTVMIAQANEMNADPWFSMPHNATEGYIRKFARTVRKNLNSDLNVYVEYSNEIWNRGFNVNRYLKDLQQSESNIELMKTYADKTTETVRLWESVFHKNPERILGVVANTRTASDLSEKLLSNLEEGVVDVFATNAYFGGYMGRTRDDSDLTFLNRLAEKEDAVDYIFKEIFEGNVWDTRFNVSALDRLELELEPNKDLAEKYNLGFTVYEGGQHLVGSFKTHKNPKIEKMFIEANRDPRMGQAFNELYETWNTMSTGVFNTFKDVSTPSKWGSWGVLENIYALNVPKYEAFSEAGGRA